MINAWGKLPTNVSSCFSCMIYPDIGIQYFAFYSSLSLESVFYYVILYDNRFKLNLNISVYKIDVFT